MELALADLRFLGGSRMGEHFLQLQIGPKCLPGKDLFGIARNDLHPI